MQSTSTWRRLIYLDIYNFMAKYYLLALFHLAIKYCPIFISYCLSDNYFKISKSIISAGWLHSYWFWFNQKCILYYYKVMLLIHYCFKRGVNPEFLKFIDRCSFWFFTVTYIKVYIFGKVMSRRIHFWYQISPKMLIFWENHKKITFLAQNFCDKLTKIILS